MLNIRSAKLTDAEEIWRILQPVLRAGETRILPREVTKGEAISYWFTDGNQVFVAEEDGNVLGTYYRRVDHPGGGEHLCIAEI